MDTDALPEGVSLLDHTADVGMEVEAATLEDLLVRAARGLVRLLYGEGDTGGGAVPLETHERSLALSADDAPALLRSWLRELLWWDEMDGFSFRSADFGELAVNHLEARVQLVKPGHEPIREIKGVTLHGLLAERRQRGWVARVIFDV
jgi:SHS2 domain-containing protein